MTFDITVCVPPLFFDPDASGTRDAAKTRLRVPGRFAARPPGPRPASATGPSSRRDRPSRIAHPRGESLQGGDQPKVQENRRENPAIRRKLLDLHGGVRALKNLGFSLEEPTSEFYEWCQGEDGVEPAAAVEAIRAALKDCENESLNR